MTIGGQIFEGLTPILNILLFITLIIFFLNIKTIYTSTYYYKYRYI